MRYIFLTFVIMNITLSAFDYNFSAFRQEQRVLVLKEFKELYKVRKNIHYNMRQVLKHARSKNLQKRSISFFQAKKAIYKEAHPMELSNVYLGGETNAEEYTEGTISISDTSLDGDEPKIRGGISNPWIRQ